MSNISKNLRENRLEAPNGVKVAIVQSTYNSDVTDKLTESCVMELEKAGIPEKNVERFMVPGAWELPFGCQLASKSRPDVIIAIGCIIKGETPHFDFIAKAVSDGIMGLSLKIDLPIIFGVLTTLNEAQAKARTQGGARGDKGVEVAQATIQMLNLKN
ncbi:MAG: 6,7-dimethyl-8-ribityllumazine synthase [Candidatus Peregrinibacteria bacterium]|nr:6,7-dimethyl-8-ribityllumazine synthase [Candidatus Peregrinibacteria bacterium]